MDKIINVSASIIAFTHMVSIKNKLRKWIIVEKQIRDHLRIKAGKSLMTRDEPRGLTLPERLSTA